MNDLALLSANTSQSVNVLRTIRDPDCNLSIWKRDLHPDLSDLPPRSLQNVCLTTPVTRLRENLLPRLREANFEGLAARNVLADDIQTLADEFCTLLRISTVEIRLDIVTTNACRKWHADYVKARLITSYLGSGTQWLENTDADRVRQGQEPLRINELSPGDVGIFKGRLATDSPVIHRSPPIEGTGETRLLLVLNPGDA